MKRQTMAAENFVSFVSSVAKTSVFSVAQHMFFHVSEAADIERFDPRPSALTHEPVVWAIDEERLRNYLVPRDCPRVTY